MLTIFDRRSDLLQTWQVYFSGWNLELAIEIFEKVISPMTNNVNITRKKNFFQMEFYSKAFFLAPNSSYSVVQIQFVSNILMIFDRRTNYRIDLIYQKSRKNTSLDEIQI